tara:strand:+ start:498 stop:824 length:327 start_codon:yes stop_codon:yes gene_type:complete
MIDYRLQNEEPTDEEILAVAYENAWLLFSGEKTFTEIALTPYMSESYMPFDPYETMDEEKFEYTKENMLSWFIDLEEYERCAYIRDFTYQQYKDMMTPFDMGSNKIDI